MKTAYIVLALCVLSSNVFAQKVLFLGDSLTEGYGVEENEAYPSVVEKILKEKGHKNIKVINAGVSGSTTASGLSRLNWFFKSKPDIIVIALGANDGLRGLKVEKSKENLSEIIKKSKKLGLKIILGGMLLPRNYGKKYREDFANIYPELKKKYEISLIPFLLKDVGGKSELNLADGIHPNSKGHKIVAETVIKYLEPML